MIVISNYCKKYNDICNCNYKIKLINKQVTRHSYIMDWPQIIDRDRHYTSIYTVNKILTQQHSGSQPGKSIHFWRTGTKIWRHEIVSLNRNFLTSSSAVDCVRAKENGRRITEVENPTVQQNNRHSIHAVNNDNNIWIWITTFITKSRKLRRSLIMLYNITEHIHDHCSTRTRRSTENIKNVEWFYAS